MKQIDECLDRHFDGKPPLNKKWKAIQQLHLGKNLLCVFHYHHLVVVYDPDTKEILHEWAELPTDKRGLDAIKEYLNKRFNTDFT